MLPAPVWEQRHAAVRALLVLHAAGLLVFGLTRHADPVDLTLSVSRPLAAAAISGLPGVSQTLRATLASLGLMTAAALLVHLAGGSIEAHFDFFVMVPVVAMYEEWVPFGASVAFVLIQHGLLGQVDPRETFDHPDAWHQPWKWAALHAAFLGAACIGSIVNWRLHEAARRGQERLTADLAVSAETDSLTGLPNRSVLLRQGRELAGAKLVVLLLDLDRFKDVNDTLGHSSGDALLRRLADRLRKELPAEHLLVRLGGDEFGVLLRDLDGPDAVAVGERLRSALSTPVAIDELLLEVDASIGVAVASSAAAPAGESLTDPESEDIEMLLRHADIAMYAAKAAGGGVLLYTDDLDTHDRSRLTQLTDLRRGLGRGELFVYYQPKISIDTGRVVGAEALVRWNHPTQGLLAPGAFLPAAEMTPLITPLTQIVLELAAKQAADWYRRGHAVPVAVNLAARTIHDSWVVQAVRDTLARHDLPASLLRLEITESTLLVNPRAAMSTLQALRAMGVGLSVDDFGTGYSSLGYLKHLPVDEIKVDRSFVATMLTSQDEAAIVKSVVDLGHNLGLTVVAEGVEDEGTLAALRALSCDIAQGYLIGRPGPADAMQPLLAAAGIGVPAQRVSALPAPATRS
jgi:diguanylate cyclase (GGDEF)-like protein